MEPRIEVVPLDAPDALLLIAELNEELAAQYPEPGANHFRLDADEVEPERGAFLVAYLSDQPVGCGALRLIDDDTAELKRMYTRANVRGQGIARVILHALEQQAVRLAVRRLVLETGTRQLAALAFYGKEGFEDIEPFGEYVDSPLSVCMAKQLVGG